LSHLVTVAVEVRDLNALKKACERLGFQFVAGATRFEWFGRWMDDYDGADAAHRHGIKPEDYGRCQHKIVVPGTSYGYEIGVVARPDGGYTLALDNFDPGLNQAVGGEGAPRLVQAYAVEKVRMEALAQGHLCREQRLDDGSIRLTLQGF